MEWHYLLYTVVLVAALGAIIWLSPMSNPLKEEIIVAANQMRHARTQAEKILWETKVYHLLSRL
jgi:hypothetical protein